MRVGAMAAEETAIVPFGEHHEGENEDESMLVPEDPKPGFVILRFCYLLILCIYIYFTAMI